jgi:hypothetical protein
MRRLFAAVLVIAGACSAGAQQSAYRSTRIEAFCKNGTIAGRVVDPRDDPVAGAVVELLEKSRASEPTRSYSGGFGTRRTRNASEPPPLVSCSPPVEGKSVEDVSPTTKSAPAPVTTTDTPESLPLPPR